jgi:hypothetical protein
MILLGRRGAPSYAITVLKMVGGFFRREQKGFSGRIEVLVRRDRELLVGEFCYERPQTWRMVDEGPETEWEIPRASILARKTVFGVLLRLHRRHPLLSQP